MSQVRCIQHGTMQGETRFGNWCSSGFSYPHFYMADPWYLNNVEGLKPDKEKHEFYVDISPKFGFPLAIRPKFQLNAIIERDADIEVMAGFREERLVLPFLWAQDGFSEPSE